jgi:hypothetical protein
MSLREQICHFIPCSCQAGGLLVRGIDFEYDDEPHSVYIYNVHTVGRDKLGFWQRIKDAWSILWGRNIRLDDAVIDKEGIIKFRDVCQDALNRWPEDYANHFEKCSLDEFYQSMEDEDTGRKLRLRESKKGSTISAVRPESPETASQRLWRDLGEELDE